jgi:hypothetical protein
MGIIRLITTATVAGMMINSWSTAMASGSLSIQKVRDAFVHIQSVQSNWKIGRRTQLEGAALATRWQIHNAVIGSMQREIEEIGNQLTSDAEVTGCVREARNRYERTMQKWREIEEGIATKLRGLLRQEHEQAAIPVLTQVVVWNVEQRRIPCALGTNVETVAQGISLVQAARTAGMVALEYGVLASEYKAISRDTVPEVQICVAVLDEIIPLIARLAEELERALEQAEAREPRLISEEHRRNTRWLLARAVADTHRWAVDPAGGGGLGKLAYQSELPRYFDWKTGVVRTLSEVLNDIPSPPGDPTAPPMTQSAYTLGGPPLEPGISPLGGWDLNAEHIVHIPSQPLSGTSAAHHHPWS